MVFGGGNVAMDAARTALRLGADSVTLAYRRTEAERPARLAEVHHAKEEGVHILELVNPLEFIKGEDGFVSAVKLERMELGEPDASGRRRPVPVADSAFHQGRGRLCVRRQAGAHGTRRARRLRPSPPGPRGRLRL